MARDPASASAFAWRVALSRRPDPPELLLAVDAGPGRLLLEGGPGGVAGWGCAAAAPGGSGGSGGSGGRWSLATGAPVRVLAGSPRPGRGGPGGRAPGGGPLAAIGDLLARLALPPQPGLPPFCGGLAGYLGYEGGGWVERLPAPRPGGAGMPDFCLGLYEAVLALDHASGEVWACGVRLPGRGRAAEARATAWAQRLQALVAGGRTGGGSAGAAPAPVPGPAEAGAAAPFVPAGPVTSSLDAGAFMAAVQRAREYIAAGDIFQVNLAQRYALPLLPAPGAPDPGPGAAGLAAYLRLRRLAPAPFAAYLEGPDFAIASASPERFLLVEPGRDGHRVETRPIKGTRPRGATPEADAALARELLASAKDAAELVMIVDLERNDLGRVCRYGTVTVTELRRLESYPTVHHTVATVTGILRPGATVAGLLRAAFPGGSITGAPKVRAMEIINELEPVPRGVYTGTIGYLGLDGRADLNIVIRTVVLAGGHAWFHAGCGIVADSDPADEYAESVAKARAMGRAFGVELPQP